MELRNVVPAAVSTVEQIGVPSGALEAHRFAGDFIYQQPVRRDVGIAEPAPSTFERMVKLTRGQWPCFNQQGHQGFEFAHIAAAPLRLLHVTPELAGVGRLAHQMPSCLKRSPA